MIWKIGFTALNFLILLFLVFPLLILIIVSFTNANFLTFPPEGFSLKWYIQMFEDSSFMEAFKFSAILATISTTISVIIGVPASQVIARKNFIGKNIVMNLISSPLLLPQIFLGVSLLQFFYYFTNTPANIWSLIISHVVLTLPYIIRTCTSTFVGFDQSIEEAAEDLGANKIKVFFLVILPIIKTGIIAGALFAFAISWINVEVTIFLSSPDQMALPVKMFNYVQYTIDPIIAAVSAITIYIAFALIVIIDHLAGIENIASE